MMDFRRHRREAFIRWWAWSLIYGDCDPALWLFRYLHDRYEHNSEERLWLAWLYGNTYHAPTAWLLKQEFPDFELADAGRMTRWTDRNYKRLRYQVDTKWNKGRLPEMFKSYAQFVGGGTQMSAFERFYGDNEVQTYEALWREVRKFHRFGRYVAWFYLQTLKHTAGVPMQPTSLMLADYSGSRSHRNGLLFALGRDSDVDSRLTAREYAALEAQALDIELELHMRFPALVRAADAFSMETVLCSYKKLFRRRRGRYLGYYLDRQADEIRRVEADGWPGVAWGVLWQARAEILDARLLSPGRVQPELMARFLDGGELMRQEWL